ncbi:hypothetical protein KY345_06705 [Candidatus Woesearchaeota archaeon]|nr:hypothetical protein [Candidatus Woesearchaeota archaeon]
MKKTLFSIMFLIILSAIVYAAPQVSDVSITNTAPILTDDNVVCEFTLNNTAGEAVWANVTWYKNSVAQDTRTKGPVTSAQTLTDTLLSSETAKGQSWYCSVYAYNTTATSGSVNSATVVIVNTNVSLSDIPAQTHVEDESSVKKLDLTPYTTDPDSDTITYSATNDANVVCGISGDDLTFVPVMGFTGAAYCNVTAYDGTHLTDPKTVTINVEPRVESLSIGSIPALTAVHNAGGSSSGTFKITNTGNVDQGSITFSKSDLVQQGNSSNKIPASAIQVNSGSPLSLDAGASKDVTVRVTASSYAVGTYTGTVNTSYGANDITRGLTLTIREQGAFLSVPGSVYLGASSGQDRDEYVSGSFDISNSGVAGDKTLTNMEVSSTAGPEYNVTFSLSSGGPFESTVSGFSLSPGSSMKIYYEGYIPEDADAGKDDIGNIDVKSTEVSKTIAGFYTNTESMLSIYDIDVEVDGDTDSSISVSGDDIDEKAYPGSVVKFGIRVENEFSSSTDIEIEDVVITVRIVGIEGEDEDDMEEDTSPFDVRDDSRSDRKWLTFELPYDVEEDTYDVEIEVEGQDEEYGSEHTVSTTLTLEVDRRSHDIKIMRARLGREDIGCEDYTTFNVMVKNIGDDEENEVVLTVKSPELGLSYTSPEFELVEDPYDDDNEFSKILTIDLRDIEVSSGTYPIKVNVYYSEDIISDTETAYLAVSCDGIEQEQEEAGETVELEQEADLISEGGGALAQEVYETVEKGFTGSAGYFVLLVLANLIVIGAAVFLVFHFLVKPKE